MTFISENVNRKIDGLGRIIIPKSIRDRFNWNSNDILDFSVCYEGDKIYVCLSKHVDVSKAEILASELEGMGLPVPEELQKMLRES